MTITKSTIHLRISAQQSAALLVVPHFMDSSYVSLDLNALLNHYIHHFVNPLIDLVGAPKLVADIGTGYGWLAIAFALHTKSKVIAMDNDQARLTAAKQIAAILGVADRITWIVGSIGAIPLGDQSVDAVYCVEVIEHVGTKPEFIGELSRVTRDVLVITTPNKIFPIINHDTALPFCHWLPLGWRNVYAKACGRRSLQHNNMFWSPFKLNRMADFNRISKFFQFVSYEDYKQTNDLLSDYSRTGTVIKAIEFYYSAVSKLGRWSIFVLPNLASTFRRRV